MPSGRGGQPRVLPVARACALATLLPLALLGATPAGAQEPPGERGTLVRVVEGDVLDVALQGSARTTRVRLLGVDAPETDDPRQPVHCFGAEAAARARELLPAGQTVLLTVDPGPDRLDRYGRLLAYVALPDGRDLGRSLLAEGYAREAPVRAPYARQGDYRAVAAAARGAGVGLWAAGGCAGETGPGDLSPGAVVTDFVYAGPFDPQGADRDCGDFRSWNDAQAFYLAAGGPESDRHRLDQGGIDGLACEALDGSPLRGR